MSFTKKRMFVAADGFGEDLKTAMVGYLNDRYSNEIEVCDLGTDTYFDAAGKVGKAISKDTSSNGLLICGTGMGVGMVANNYAGVRAATVENVLAARFSRAVNDANVLCLGQLITPVEKAKPILDAFLSQEFNAQPALDDGTPAPWWNENVEKFLSTSQEGIARVETDAMECCTSQGNGK